MEDRKRLTNALLLILGILFIACLVSVVVLNNSTQTEIFWDNQMDKLALITEKCVLQINGWADVQMTIMTNLASEIEAGRFYIRKDFEAYLDVMVSRNPQIQAAYLFLDNGMKYYNSGFEDAGSDVDNEFAIWYEKAKAAGKVPIMTEPYFDIVTRELVVSCLQAVTMPDGTPGVVGTDVSLKDLHAMVDNLFFSDLGGAYLVSQQGRVMTYVDPALQPKIVDGKSVFSYVDEVTAQVEVLETYEKHLDKGIEISYIVDYDKARKYEAVAMIPEVGWKLGLNIPLSDYDQEVQQVINMQNPIIALAVMMSLISIIVAGVLVSGMRRQQELLKGIEVARAKSKTKSEFLSRMSHEMRTPMNAIIGMTKIADNTVDVSKLRYCLATIEASSTHLLGIINDVLDMSKIEAGKFELDSAPMNIEKILMKICNLIIDKAEQKDQKLEIILGKNMGIHYTGDEVRLSQVITNLLSNAVKFTPENGEITLRVEETERTDTQGVLRFVITDTGIGMTEEQMGRLFTSFEQADSSITRRFGGTGLGLAISKSIVEKMGGGMWVESVPDKGSTFTFEVRLTRAPEQGGAKIYDGIAPRDIRVLVVDDDSDVRAHLKSILDNFEINADEACSGKKAVHLTDRAKETDRPYDVIFIDYDMPEMNGIETVRKLNALIDKNTVIIMTSFLKWNKLESEAQSVGVSRFIAKPLFPSSVLNAINEVVGKTLKELDIKLCKDEELPDFSGFHMLLVEDVEINREIFVALLENTKIDIDTAENGLVAVEKFKQNADRYDMIIMDVQMPEMDGHQAAKTIRALDMEKAKTIPIVAMTANVFKEDVERCMESGMNGHLSKPIDERAVIEKMRLYLKR